MDRATPKEAPTLFVHEWLAVVCMCGVLLFLIALALKNPTISPLVDQGQGHYIVEPTLQITVEGFVEEPGVHTIHRSQTVRDLLVLAKPLPEADLEKLKLDAKLRKGQVLRVPSKLAVAFRIEGVGTFKVPRGTRLKELHKYVNLPEGIDNEALNSRRQIKEGEILILPLKNA